MNASSKHVYDSDKEVKGRENKFYLNRKFKQFDTGKEESGSSSYLSLSGHDSGVTRQSSMSYVSVDETGTVSDISSGYLSVDENQDSEYDDSCNSGNNCFSCIDDGIVTEATHMCHTCLPEKQYICHKCLKQHNKFCDGHDVISLSVKCEQRHEPNSNSSEQTYNSYNRYGQAVPLKAKNIHKRITDLSNQKEKMQESGKKTFYETVTMDHKKYSEHQLTILPKQLVVPSTDSTDELKRSVTHIVAKPMGLSTDSVPLRHVDKASQTDFSDELKHSLEEMAEKHGTSEFFPTDSVQSPTSDKSRTDYHQTMLSLFLEGLKTNALPLEEKPGDLSLFSTDNDSHKNKNGEGDIAFLGKANSTVRNKNKINQLQKDCPVDRRKVKASFTDRNKNKRNQYHLQKVPELEKETPHTALEEVQKVKHSSKQVTFISDFTDESNKSLPLQNPENHRNVSLLSTITEQLARNEQFHKDSGLSKKKLDRLYRYDDTGINELLAFTRYKEQNPPEDVAYSYGTLQSGDLNKCSGILAALKSDDEIKVLQSVSERCKTKPNYRMAVVTAEVFKEDLTYSNYYPRDCKMIIGIPVYKGGFINRRDNKDRGISG